MRFGISISIVFLPALVVGFLLQAGETVSARERSDSSGAGSPFEKADRFAPANALDVHVLAALRKRGIPPAQRCSDAVFFRRIHIDVIGKLPEPEEVKKFLLDKHPAKRAKAIEGLLFRAEFADYWALKWCDLLRVKAEFPINLWPNAVQAYHRWIRDAIRQNRPYDWFARELLTSSGSNFRVPPVNFYRAVQRRDPSALASTVALTFMGTRLNTWPEGQRKNLAAFFSRVAYKPTAEWKEEIVHLDPTPILKPMEAVLPDGTRVRIQPDEDPRRVFADWLISTRNPWFARNIVNRVWAWLLGRGIIHEPDDIRSGNPAVNPELLACLERELKTAKFDLRSIYRLILNSRTYQQSSVPASKHADAEKYFAHYKVRCLDAEVLADAFAWLGGRGERYTSAIPEPFTYIPEYHSSVTLADGSITSQFLEMFGRPSRDTGLESERGNKASSAQRLFVLNSTRIQELISKSPRLRAPLRKAKLNRREAIRSIYFIILSRSPVQAELEAAEAYCKKSGLKTGSEDLAWALINSKEFLYRH